MTTKFQSQSNAMWHY